MRLKRWALRTAVAIVALVVVAVAALAVRLAIGPIPLTAFVPQIEKGLSGPQGGYDVAIGSLALAWDGDAVRPALRADDVVVQAADGARIARLPATDLGVSLEQLLLADIAFSTATIRQPTLTVALGPNGQLALGPDGSIALGGAAGEEAGPVLDRVLTALASPTEAGAPERLAPLSDLKIIDGTVTIRDVEADRSVVLNVSELSLQRGGGTLEAGFDLSAELDGTTTALQGSAAYPVDAGPLSVDATVSELRPALFASLVPLPEAASRVELPLSGDVRLDVARDGRLVSAEFAVSGGSGTVAIPGVEIEPLTVRSLEAGGAWDGDARTLTLSEGRVALGSEDTGPTVTLIGTAEASDSDIAADGEVGVSGLRADDLDRYWPPAVAPGARTWVAENITEGMIEQVDVQIAATVPRETGAAASLQSADGSMSYRGLTVHALRPMPPITGIDGTATITESKLTFEVAGGQVLDLQIADAAIAVSGLEAATQQLRVEANLSGPLASVVRLLNQPPLSVAMAGAQPQRVGGTVTADLAVALPLEKELALEEVEVTGTAEVSSGSAEGLFGGLQLSNADLSVEADASSLQADGSLRVNGSPATLDAVYRYDGTTTINAHVDGLGLQARRALGLGWDPYLQGPTTVDVHVELDKAGSGRATFNVDLSRATLAVPTIGWRKEAGSAGQAKVGVGVRSMSVQSVESVSVHANTLRVEGSVSLAQDGLSIAGARLSQVALGETELRDVVVERAGDGFAVTVGGGRVNAAPLLANGGLQGVAVAGGDGSAPSVASNFTLDAPSLDSIRLGEGRALQGASVHLVRADGAWQRAELAGELYQQGSRVGSIDIDVGPLQGGRLPVEVDASPLGSLAEMFGISRGVQGGHLSFSGSAAGVAQPLEDVRGTVIVKDLTVLPDSLSGKAIAAADMPEDSGIKRGEPMRFDRIEASGSKSGDVVTIDSLTAHRSSLGVRGSGTVNVETGALDMSGNVIPLRKINTVLGKVPVFGDIFTAGAGLFVVEVDVTGTISEPKFNTQIVKSLTPNLLAPFKGLLPSPGG